MCKKISKNEKHLEVIKRIECTQNYHDKREAMGALTVSLFCSSFKSKELTIFYLLTEYKLSKKQSLDQIENDYNIKQYIKILIRLISHTEKK